MSAYRRRGFGSSHIRYLGSRGGSGGHGRGRGGRGRGGHHQSGQGFNAPSGNLIFLTDNEDRGLISDDGENPTAGPSRHRSTSRTYENHTESRNHSKSPSRQNRGGATGRGLGNDRPPSHLKGRDIGLWYRDRYKQKKKSETTEKSPALYSPTPTQNRSQSPTGHARSKGRENVNTPERVKVKPPKHIKGKNLTLWYRDLYKDKTTRPGLFLFDSDVHINLSVDRQGRIMTLLDKLGNPSHNLDSERPSASASFERHIRKTRVPCAGIGEVQSHPTPVVTSRVGSLDEYLKEQFETKLTSNPKYRSMLEGRRSLPAYEYMNEVLEHVIQNQVVVISGETGCGKTTQIPQFILDRWIMDGNGSICNVLCTQPRRISAISVAQRVAEERDESVGGKSIGYSIRLDSKLPSGKGGTITFCTTGVVLQILKDDPFLNRVSHLIVDEIHERDVLCDFLLAIIKDLIPQRPDLKVVLMSATLNAPHFQNYFDNCPLFHISGMAYPVAVHHLEDVVEMTKFVFEDNPQGRFSSGRPRGGKKAAIAQSKYEHLLGPYLRSLERTKAYSRPTINQIGRQECEELSLDLIAELLSHICSTDHENASILVFLPGWDNISTLHNLLTTSGKFDANRHMIIPLHSMMPTVNQREVFDRPPPGKRKIILSTNIAETSITIDDIVYVIDCGKIKMTNFDIALNIETLQPEWVSLANAKQRRGRAGRVQAGVCYHLFSKGREALMEDFMKPEVLRKRLEEVVLQIKMLNLGKAAIFFNTLLDPPDPKAVDLAIKRLVKLNALDLEENLTPLGFHLAQLPMDPMTGRMILLGAIFSCCDPILSVAASLSFKNAFVMPMGQEKEVDSVRLEFAAGSKSDHLVLVRALAGYENAKASYNQRDYCYRNYLSIGTLNMLTNLKGQFAQNLFDLKFLPSADWRDSNVNMNSRNDALVKAIICAGLYPNVAKVRPKKFSASVYTLEDGRVDFHPKSVNAKQTSFESPFVVYHQKMKTSSIFLHDTTMASPLPLVFFGGQLNCTTEGGYEVLGVDETVRFRCRKNIYEIIERLRGHLDRLLEDKIRNPVPTMWNTSSRETDLLRAIVELITSENREIMNEDPASDSYDEMY